MNTRAKKYALALPFIAVMAVLLAFSTPAAAYTGDHPLTIYDHDTINGGLVYDTVTDGSKYASLWPVGPRFEHLRPVLYQDLTVSIPAGATVKMARLYNTYCWSCWENNDYRGMPANAKLTLTDTSTDETWVRNCTHDYTPATVFDCPNPINSTVCPDCESGVEHYWDMKDDGVWALPSGEFAWDVTGLVTHTGTYKASICDPRDRARVGDERFVTFGFVLLVVYKHPDSPGIEYWIAEGCDILMGGFGTPEYATSSTTFGGVSGAISANLTTVLTCSSGGKLDPPLNMVYFNDEEIGPSTADGSKHYGVNLFDVTSLLSPYENVVAFQDRYDCEYVHNAWLVVEKQLGICGDVNDDGVVNESDVTLLENYVGYPGYYTVNDEWAADVNCDEEINVGDVILLNNHLKNPALYPLK